METTAWLNKLRYNATLITEEAKDRHLRGFKQPTPFNQITIGSLQFERELVALERYPIIVTDSPVHLASVYSLFYGGSLRIAGILTDIASLLDEEYPALNVLLPKPPIYDNRNRWQDEQEADRVQEEILSYLTRLEIPYIHAPSLGEILKIVQEGLDKGVVPSYG